MPVTYLEDSEPEVAAPQAPARRFTYIEDEQPSVEILGQTELEGLRDKEAQEKSMLRGMQAAFQRIRQAHAQDPRNWTHKQLEDHFKKNPPKTIQEQAHANAALELKKKQEEKLTDEVLIAGRYMKEQLAKKAIPQFTKGLSESDLGRAAEPLMKRLPNADVIQEVQAGTPSPEGFAPTMARLLGNIAPYAAMSQPFVSGAGAVPLLKGASDLAKVSAGIGAYEGTKKLVEGKPQEAPAAAASGAALTYGGGKAIEGVGALAKVGGKALSSTVGQIPQVQEAGLKVQQFLGRGEKSINRIIDQVIDKAIRPTVVGKGSSSQVSNYYNKAREAVKTIVENKKDLNLTDEFGESTNKLPETLNEFSQAIDQTKKKIFAQYDALKSRAGSTGVRLELTDVADDIEKQVNSNAVSSLYPELQNYALHLSARLRQVGSYSLDEAQQAIEMLNNSLKAFYRNPNPQAASKAVLDSAIATKLRNALDDLIEGITGQSYQALKNKYGALRTIQEEVTKRAIVDARKNVKGFFDLGEIFSAGDIVKGLMSMNPSEVAKGGAMRAMIAMIKSINNPNRMIKNMFYLIDKAHRPALETVAKSGEEIGQRMIGSQGSKLLLEGPKPSRFLEASEKFGEGFERMAPQEALKRIRDFAFKHYSAAEKKIVFPEGMIFSDRTKTLLRGMGINPYSGEVKSPRILNAFEAALRRAKSTAK